MDWNRQNVEDGALRVIKKGMEKYIESHKTLFFWEQWWLDREERPENAI